MAATKSKYVSVWSKEAPMLALKMSSLAAEGYTVVETMLQPVFAYPDGSTAGGDFYALMKLRDEQLKLEEAEDLINVDIAGEGGEISRRIKEGWVIVASFAKVVTMVKRKICTGEKVLISPELRAQKEATAQ